MKSLHFSLFMLLFCLFSALQAHDTRSLEHDGSTACTHALNNYIHVQKEGKMLLPPICNSPICIETTVLPSIYVKQNDIVNFQIKVTNAGCAITTNYLIQDILPTQLAFTSAGSSVGWAACGVNTDCLTIPT